MGWPGMVNLQVRAIIGALEGVDSGMVSVPRPPPGPAARARALVAATHAGPTVAVTVVATLLLGPAPGILLLVLVASGWAYNAWLKRTPASLVPYCTGFGAL